MALELEKELDSGVVAKYWSISKIETANNVIRVHLSLHVSKEIKDAGKKEIEKIVRGFSYPKADVIAGNIYEIAYSEIKKSNIIDEVEQNEFASAIDV